MFNRLIYLLTLQHITHPEIYRKDTKVWYAQRCTSRVTMTACSHSGRWSVFCPFFTWANIIMKARVGNERLVLGVSLVDSRSLHVSVWCVLVEGRGTLQRLLSQRTKASQSCRMWFAVRFSARARGDGDKRQERELSVCDQFWTARLILPQQLMIIYIYVYEIIIIHVYWCYVLIAIFNSVTRTPLRWHEQCGTDEIRCPSDPWVGLSLSWSEGWAWQSVRE